MATRGLPDVTFGASGSLPLGSGPSVDRGRKTTEVSVPAYPAQLARCVCVCVFVAAPRAGGGLNLLSHPEGRAALGVWLVD